jgi:hypothetical protein
MVGPDVSQQDVMAFLATPAAYGPGVTRVDRIDTHIGAVFLADDRVYNIHVSGRIAVQSIGRVHP